MKNKKFSRLLLILAASVLGILVWNIYVVLDCWISIPDCIPGQREPCLVVDCDPPLGYSRVIALGIVDLILWIIYV